MTVTKSEIDAALSSYWASTGWAGGYLLRRALRRVIANCRCNASMHLSDAESRRVWVENAEILESAIADTTVVKTVDADAIRKVLRKLSIFRTIIVASTARNPNDANDGGPKLCEFMSEIIASLESALAGVPAAAQQPAASEVLEQIFDEPAETTAQQPSHICGDPNSPCNIECMRELAAQHEAPVSVGGGGGSGAAEPSSGHGILVPIEMLERDAELDGARKRIAELEAERERVGNENRANAADVKHLSDRLETSRRRISDLERELERNLSESIARREGKPAETEQP